MKRTKVSKQELSHINDLLIDTEWIKSKSYLAMFYSYDCTSVLSQLSQREANELIGYLKEYKEERKAMRVSIISLAIEAGIINVKMSEDFETLNDFLLQKGRVKKEFLLLTEGDLKKTLSQFKQIVKMKNERIAKKATKKLLQELNLSTINF